MLARIGRILLRTVMGLLIFIVILLLVFDRLVQFRMDDKELLSWFHERHVGPTISYYESRGRRVRYLSTGTQPDATVLFIHGAPSSLSYWKDYLSDSLLLSRATMYAI